MKALEFTFMPKEHEMDPSEYRLQDWFSDCLYVAFMGVPTSSFLSLADEETKWEWDQAGWCQEEILLDLFMGIDATLLQEFSEKINFASVSPMRDMKVCLLDGMKVTVRFTYSRERAVQNYTDEISKMNDGSFYLYSTMSTASQFARWHAEKGIDEDMKKRLNDSRSGGFIGLGVELARKAIDAKEYDTVGRDKMRAELSDGFSASKKHKPTTLASRWMEESCDPDGGE